MARATITRRGFLGHTAGAFAATAIVGGTAVAISDLSDLRLMAAYNQWLAEERAALMAEAFAGEDPSFVHIDTPARQFHLPPNRNWKGVPPPSTRARLILGSAGLVL